jgi:hypothetical protein
MDDDVVVVVVVAVVVSHDNNHMDWSSVHHISAVVDLQYSDTAEEH